MQTYKYRTCFRTREPSDLRTFGFENLRNWEPSDLRTFGLEDLRNCWQSPNTSLADPDQGRIQADAIDANASVRKKFADAFIGQIFTANNKKQQFLRKHKAYNAQISTKLLFPRNDYDTYSKFTPERFVFPKTCPRTITLTFPPLIYSAMFQNLLFNNVNIKRFIFDFVGI